ncbi:MAG: hypothetical protein QOF76_3900 [Solirubrobacteraceae bacterium]|nr:hypothetical protein [Solirubrobacteraceae bacterium]
MSEAFRSFYAREYVEADRLWATPHGCLERVRTWELLERHLPPAPARVLDVGGGPGVHAEWLASRGYAVRLIDPVHEHVEQAAGLDGVGAAVGDARSLGEADSSFDAVLLLGPLYHLLEGPDRMAALSEALRVVVGGGLVVAAGIGRYAGLLDLAAQARLNAATEPVMRQILADGRHRPELLGFTDAYLHRPEELEAEMVAAGLADVVVYGIEGPATNALDAYGMDRLDEFLDSAVRGARMVERDPALINASAHLLVAGRRARTGRRR